MLYGVAMIAIGALMVAGARAESESLPYRLIAARARVLWKERTHQFLKVSGGLVIIAGLIVMVGYA